MILDPPPHPFYCEENAWRECRRALAAGDSGPVEAIFISNRGRTCAVWQQRAADKAGEPVVWDYHVVVRAGPDIRDVDSLLGPAVPVRRWLEGSFPHGEAIDARYLPWFRRVPAAVYLAEFASDRRHMRRPDGRYDKPHPPWPPIQTPDGRTHTLPRFLDFHSERYGPWLSLRKFAQALAAEALPPPEAV